MNGLAPICLFVHNRPAQTRRALDALAHNPMAGESELYVFCDGPQGPADLAAVREVRSLVHRERRFRRVLIHERQHHGGRTRAVLSGLDDLFRCHDAVIILEDDLETCPQFLAFMNEGLSRYRLDPRVGAIQGWHAGPGDAPNGIYFSRYFTPWGWATWRRAWEGFEPDAGVLLRKLEGPGLKRKFNLDGRCSHHRRLVEQQHGTVHCWHIRWYASQFLLGRLALCPGRSLVVRMDQEAPRTQAAQDSAYAGLSLAFALEMKDIKVIEDRAAAAQLSRSHEGRLGPVRSLLDSHCPAIWFVWKGRALGFWRALLKKRVDSKGAYRT